MRIDCISGDIRAVKADMVVVNLFEGAKRPGFIRDPLEWNARCPLR